MNRNLRRLIGALRPEGLRDAELGWQFGADHHLTSGRFAQARYWRQVQSFALDLLPPIRLADSLIVDVGANAGDFTATVLAIEPAARVLAIEPAPATYDLLAARFAADTRVRVDGTAVTDSRGTVGLNLTKRSVFASILPPRESVCAEYGDGPLVTGRAQVPTGYLDDLIDEPVSVLKIDVQGAEAAVLRGAERTLGRTQAILMEILFVSHYDGDVTFLELHRMMEERGWALRTMGRPHLGKRTALWADACYVPVS